jgi:uncharacterized SAM-binding protein YcdF (DUF218 family)
MKALWKICKVLLALVAAVFLLDIFIVLFFAYYRPAIKPADYIVVLGSAINTPSLYNRSLQGLKLYEAGNAKMIVVSGGVDYPKSISEAEYMREVIEKNSPNPVPLILEDKSQSTYENLKNTRNIIGYGKSIIIVSDDFHLARSVLTAERLGFGHVEWSSPNPTYYNFSEQAYYYFREVFAIVDYIPKFIFG